MAKSVVFIVNSLEVDIGLDASDSVWRYCRVMITNLIREDYLRAIGMTGAQTRMGLPQQGRV